MKKNFKVLIIVLIVILALGVAGIKTFSSKNTATKGTEVVKSIPMLIDLGAGTCIPCKQMIPVLDEVKKAYNGKAVVKVIDVNDSPDEANKYGIKVIPTQIFLDKDGKEFFRHEGFFSKEEIAEIFDKMGVK